MRDYAQSQLQRAYETILTANCASDWNQALQHAQNALVGDYDQRGKATLYIAHVLVHTGKLSLATSYLSAFLRKWGASLPKQYPYAVELAAQLAYRQRRFERSLCLHRTAMRLFALAGNQYEFERAAIGLVWALARVGKVLAAHRELPSRVLSENLAIWHGVRSFLCTLTDLGRMAHKEGRLAVALKRAGYDSLDATEVLVALLPFVFDEKESFACNKLAVEFAGRQAQDVRAVLALSYRRRGGEPLDAETDNRGSADPHDGCSLTSGVA